MSRSGNSAKLASMLLRSSFDTYRLHGWPLICETMYSWSTAMIQQIYWHSLASCILLCRLKSSWLVIWACPLLQLLQEIMQYVKEGLILYLCRTFGT